MRRWDVPTATRLLTQYVPATMGQLILSYFGVEPKLCFDLPEVIMLNEVLPYVDIDDAVAIQMGVLKPYEYPNQVLWLSIIEYHYPEIYQEILNKRERYLKSYDSYISTLKAVRCIDHTEASPDLQKALLMAGLYADDHFLGAIMFSSDVVILYLQLSQVNYQEVLDRIGYVYVDVDGWPVLQFLIDHGTTVSPYLVKEIILLFSKHPEIGLRLS